MASLVGIGPRLLLFEALCPMPHFDSFCGSVGTLLDIPNAREFLEVVVPLPFFGPNVSHQGWEPMTSTALTGSHHCGKQDCEHNYFGVTQKWNTYQTLKNKVHDVGFPHFKKAPLPCRLGYSDQRHGTLSGGVVFLGPELSAARSTRWHRTFRKKQLLSNLFGRNSLFNGFEHRQQQYRPSISFNFKDISRLCNILIY